MSACNRSGFTVRRLGVLYLRLKVEQPFHQLESRIKRRYKARVQTLGGIKVKRMSSNMRRVLS